MHIHWFSPLPPARTDIAQYTQRLLPSLRQACTLTLWTDQTEIDPNIKAEYDVRQFRVREEIDWTVLNRGDAVFYHIGNNPLFHEGIWSASLLHPGIVVLHDIRLHHFFGDIYLDREQNAQKYMAQMLRFYGDSGRKAAEKFVNNNKSNIDEMSRRYPLTELAYEQALAVVVHTREAFDALQKNERKCVAYAALPYPARSVSKEQTIQKEFYQSNSDLAKQDLAGSIRLIVFGYIGKNRGLDLLLQALALMPERNHFQLNIYGEVWNEFEIKELVIALNLQNNVMLHGFVSEHELEQALEAAHLAINLRYPTMGEASGSQLRIWAHALPSIVTKIGWYASLPETVVAHAGVENTVEDLQSYLRDFLVNSKKWQEMGERGQKLLATEHTPQKYVQTLIELGRNAQRISAVNLAYITAERAATTMCFWAQEELPAVCFSQPTHEIAALFGLDTSRM